MNTDRIFIKLWNFTEFASLVNGNIKEYPQHTFYTVKEVIEHLRGCIRGMIAAGDDLDDEYGYLIPLSDTHEEVYWFKLVDYQYRENMLYIELYYRGTLK